MFGGDFGDELVTGDADRAGESQFVADTLVQPVREFVGFAVTKLGAGHIEECFIDRDLLNLRRYLG